MTRPVPTTTTWFPDGTFDAVAGIVLRRVQLPLLQPFVSSHGTEDVRDVVIVEAMGTDGISGWGECVALAKPTYSDEHTAGAWTWLRDTLVPGILAGRDVEVGASPMAWSAAEAALVDLRLRREGTSLASSVGGPRRTVACTAVVGRQGGIDELLQVVSHRLDEGYTSIKLKIGSGWDTEPLAAVRAAWPDLTLSADANGAYLADDPVLRAIDGIGLVYFEQPLPAGDTRGMARLAARLDTTIALDESIRNERDLASFLSFPFVLNLKPAPVGDRRAFVSLRLAAEKEGLSMFIGGMLETGIGRSYALAYASRESADLPTDLGPSSRYFADDITEPLELLEGGRLAVPDGPGIGVVPRPDRLDTVTVDSVQFLR